MLGLSVIILFNLIFNVNSNLAESSANCSEYILLIVSRLGPPSVYDYWLAGYSLIISQKSITTSERMPEKINDSELPRDFLARLGCSRNQE